MFIQKIFFLSTFLAFSSHSNIPLAEQFERTGYAEVCDQNNGTIAFNALYASFDEFIEFLQRNPQWKQKLFLVKERFIRSKAKNYYSTDFFGFYDESNREKRNHISFYYSTHFHEFIWSHYPEFKKTPEIFHFFEACLQIQKPYGSLFNQAATELGIDSIFSSLDGHPPLLLKVIKYLPSYLATIPHYDGTAFSLFLDSTDNDSLLLSPYKSSFIAEDFSSAHREFLRQEDQNSILLIPGTLLAEFSIYPTPHIVLESGNARYATIAFAMRPNYSSPRIDFSLLPSFSH